ncbi:MAG: mucin desulfatase [Anaerolineaceae bacterium]|nr:mucin desulfatase [Anaerolineaceae bacterium]
MQTKPLMDLLEVARQFISDPIHSIDSYLGGHIHDTYLVTTSNNGKPGRRYLLQKMNTYVFQNPQRLMENIQSISLHLQKKASFFGKDPKRTTLALIPTFQGALFYNQQDYGAWRVFDFIENTFSVESPQNLDQVRDAAAVTGDFLQMLSDFPVDSLYIPLPDFHNTPKRYQDFRTATYSGLPERIRNASKEIAFIHQRASWMNIIQDGLNNGSIPWRVTHNDTKLENILIDSSSGNCLCLIDLDTVMPGSALYDFGDAIRAMANPAGEDEKDLSLVNFQLPVFDAYTAGFLESTRQMLTPQEINLIPQAAWLITLEIGMRFLSDYLMGDTYFKVTYPENNLIRSRTQFKLVDDMEKLKNEMREIVRKYR